MELFSAEQVSDARGLLWRGRTDIFVPFPQNSDGNIPSYRLNGYITKEGLNILVDYAYTAKLEVPEDMVSFWITRVCGRGLRT